MTISSGVVWEVRTTATAGNVNGGGFKTGASGVDYSQQDAAQYALTGVTSAGIGAVFLTASAAADMVGNIAHIRSGTNFVTGWFEIISVVVGVSVTVDRNCTSGGAGSNGVINIGGAISLGNTDDDGVFESMEPGNKMWIKAGTYTLGGTVTVAKAGTAVLVIEVEGYTTVRGDIPFYQNIQPVIEAGAATFTMGNFWSHRCITFRSSAGTAVVTGSDSRLVQCRVISYRAITAAVGVSVLGRTLLYGCELVCPRGRAISTGSSAAVFIYGCYIHDSDDGIRATGTAAPVFIVGCIIESNTTNAINFTGANTTGCVVWGCTLYGSQNTTGTGITMPTGFTELFLINNLISGFVTGVTHADAQTVGYDNYNNYFNNDTDVNANWHKGSNDSTTNPAFTNVAQLTGTTATTSGSVLTQSGGDFSTVTDNVDYVYIVSGTGITAGQYKITAHTATTITLDSAPGNSAVADKVWQITTGRNFTPGTALADSGWPGAFVGVTNSLNNNHIYRGAVNALGASGGGSSIFVA